MASLHEVEGLDLEEALRCVPGAELLAELLVEFAQRWSDGAPRIAAALDAGRPREAEGIAHALAGVAATLGLRAIGDAARRIEALLESGDAGSAAAEVAALGVVLERTTSSIHRALGAP